MSTHQKGQGGRAGAQAAKRSARAQNAAEAEHQARAQAREVVADIARRAAAGDRHPVDSLYLDTHPRLSEPAQRTLRAELDRRDERSLRTLDRERGVVIDPKTGQVVVDRMGSRGAIWLNFHPTAAHPGPRGEAGEVAGRVFVHNHPVEADHHRADGSLVRGTFSEDDYRGSSFGFARNKPSEAVVTHGDIAVIMTPRADGVWPSYTTVIKPAIDRNWEAIDQELVRAARSARSPAVREALSHVSDAELLHLAWMATAQQTGIGYQRVPLSSIAGGRRGRAKKQEG